MISSETEVPLIISPEIRLAFCSVVYRGNKSKADVAEINERKTKKTRIRETIFFTYLSPV